MTPVSWFCAGAIVGAAATVAAAFMWRWVLKRRENAKLQEYRDCLSKAASPPLQVYGDSWLRGYSADSFHDNVHPTPAITRQVAGQLAAAFGDAAVRDVGREADKAAVAPSPNWCGTFDDFSDDGWRRCAYAGSHLWNTSERPDRQLPRPKNRGKVPAAWCKAHEPRTSGPAKRQGKGRNKPNRGHERGR